MFISIHPAQIYSVDKTDQEKFIQEANIIAALYGQKLGNIKVKNLKKITIELTESSEDTLIIEHSKLLPVCVFRIEFKLQSYFNAPKAKRNYIVLDLIQNALYELAQRFEWNTQPFEEAYKKVIEANFIYSYPIGKPTFSPDRKYKALLEVEFTSAYGYLYVLFTNSKGGIIKKIQVLKTRREKELLLPYIVKTGQWTSNNEYLVSNITNEIVHKVFFDTEKIELILAPGTMSRPELECLVKMFDPDISHSDSRKLEEEMSRLALKRQ